MKTKKLVLFLCSFLLFNFSYSQFTESDLTLKISGLSEENVQKFKSNTKVLIETLNELKVPNSIKPLLLEVSYKNNTGDLKLTVNFKNETIYSNGTDYSNHSREFQAYGKGISFLFQHHLMLALSEYKFAAAREDWMIKTDLAEFDNTICLKKVNGDIMKVYSYNTINNSGYGGSLFPYTFYSNVEMRIGGKTYKTECGNDETLSRMKYFIVEDLSDPSGQKTGAYYFCQFFNIKTE